MRKRKKMKWNKLRIWCKERLLRLKKPFIIVGCVWFVACIAGFFFNCLFTYHFKFRLDINLLVDGKTYLYALLLSVIALTVALAYYYKHYWLKNSKKIIQGDERDNDVAANLEQAHFQTDGEVDKNYAKISYAQLPKTNLVGIPIRAVERKGKYEIHFAKNAHTMIIGTTGSGKTTTFINPAVQILSQSAAKPSMLISDPKGELYSLHAKSLKDKGYEVKVLDLRNPYNSVRWNPLERPFLNYQSMLHIDEEVTADEERGGWVFEGELYNDPEELQSALQVKKQWLFDQVYEDLHDMITVLCPITNKNEPIWESGAKNFILAIAIAMLEDSANMQRQISAATEMLKGEAERLITNEILSEEKQIELLQAIDRHCFRQAQTIVEEAARHAAAQNFEHLISDLDTLSKKLFEVSRIVGDEQIKN